MTGAGIWRAAPLLVAMIGMACRPVDPSPGADACSPSNCEAEGKSCGRQPDGCGGELECGPPCDGGPEDGGEVDAGCPAESIQSICQRLARHCGPASAEDNCGQWRSVDCGGCAFPERCSDDAECSCTPLSCDETGVECGEAYDECGQFIDCGPCPDGGSPPPYRLRLMAGNITSGSRQSYDPGEGVRIFQGLRPDVVMIQELNYGSGSEADIRRFVDLAFGPSFFVYREAGAQIPNGIISRYPIVDSGEWNDSAVANRDFAWARIDLPGPTDLWVVSLHLLTSGGGSRAAEAAELVGYIKGAVPKGDYLAVGGDLNTSSRTESCIGTLSEVVVTGSPYPADQAGNSNTNASRGSPHDWVLVDGDLRALQVPVTLGANRFAAGLVFDSRVYQPIADVPPVQVGDSAAASMQHMGVVRDFELPAPAARP